MSKMQHCKFLLCLATMVTNYSLVIDFVAYRHSVKPLDGIIIFQTQRFSSDGLERELQHRLHLPQVIVKNMAASNLKNFTNVGSIALVFVEKLGVERRWELVSESLTTHSLSPMLFISRQVPPMDVQLRFFNYFRQENMLNTVVLFRANDTMMVRTAIAYPKLEIIAVEPSNFSGFVWLKYRNVYGYNFHLSAFEDTPIIYTKQTNNRTELGGLMAQLLPVFMKRVNGTFTVYRYPLNETMKHSIDMTANLVLRTDLIHHTMEPSYPMFQTKACLMLPLESGIPLSWYLLYAFDIYTWQMLGFTFLIFVIFASTIFRNYNRSRDLVLDMLFVLQLFLTNPIHLPAIRSVAKGIFLVYFGMLCVVIMSVYEGSLTSCLSTRVRMPAVRTPEDFLKTDLKIMSTNLERQLFFDPKLLPPSLVPRLYGIGSGISAIDGMIGNTSFAYIMSTDKWLWYEKRQKHLQHPVFRITTDTLCTPSMGKFFAMRKQSPFKGILKILALELQQFGFIDHWLAEVPPAEKLQLSDDSGMVEVPLSLAHFTLGFHILAVGWSLALVTFMGELFISRRHEIFALEKILWLRNIWARE